jgi:hypothetical protein
MQPRHVCTLKMGYWSLSCGWMEIRFNIASYITVCIGCWNVFWDDLHFISQSVFWEDLHFISQSVFLQTVLVMSTLELSVSVYYLREQLLFECLGENTGLHSVIIPKRFLIIRFSCPAIVCHIPYTWLFCHMTTRMFPVTTSFSLYTPSSYQEIFLMHTIRREIAHYSWTKRAAPGTTVTLQHTCNFPCICVTEVKGMKTRI